jgi:2-polyprenyl-3-methyl-5-hydroxy-6-metoxy-1,4-benzoquinol methylase
LVCPRSVIDVGCGAGGWLRVLKEHGIEDIWGADGEYVSKNLLEIPVERFIPHNLEQPFHSDREFDLVVSLEVAEHLPSNRSETLVDSLTRLGPVVFSSGAIPRQGDTRQIDCLRRKMWYSEEAGAWYIQNIVVFVAQEYLEANVI